MNRRGTTMLFIMLPALFAGAAAGCLPSTRQAATGVPAPAMTQNPEDRPGYWRTQYERNRPNAPEQYAVFPTPPRNNGFGEFDDGLYRGLDAQPPLPALPSETFGSAAMIRPGIGITAASGQTPPSIPPMPERFAANPTALPQPGINTGDHFYPVEQLVYGGDNGELDKPENYRLMPKDSITLAVRDHPEFSAQLEIQPDGTVRIPNAHDVVRLRGLTTDEAAEQLRQTIAVYINGPCEVRVQTNRARGGYYYVFGEVKQPGRFPMGMEPVKLSEAVLAANWEANPARRDMDGDELSPSFPAAYPRGSFQTPALADLARVALITPHRSQPVRTVHDVRSALFGITANDPIIRPGQVVVVPSLAEGRNAGLGHANPPAGIQPGFSYNDAPNRLPEFGAKPNYPAGNSDWIYTMPTQPDPEPEMEDYSLSPVEANMAAAYATATTASNADFQRHITVEGPNPVYLNPGEQIPPIEPPPEEIQEMPPPETQRRKIIRSGSRNGEANGWAKGL